MNSSKVMEYFYEICAIPHASGNTKQLSDYCVDFAKKQNLYCIQDEYGNVLIRKPASFGMESHPGVIFQGHLDMVAEKTCDSLHNFECDPLELYVEDGFLHARNTTLGGDDGIAVAYALSLLADQNLVHPPLEVLLTVDEETGMIGANHFDTSILTGTYLLNCDSEEEGILTAGCAGGVRADMSFPMDYLTRVAKTVNLHFEGFLGGHSGVEIHKEHANAHKIFGRLLYTLAEQVRFSVSSVYGGTKDNVIAMQLDATLHVEEEDLPTFLMILEHFNADLLNEYAGTKENIHIVAKVEQTEEALMLAPSSLETLIFILVNLPDGVYKHNPHQPDLVETSINCGILGLLGDTLKIGCLIRSSIDSAKKALFCQVKYLAEMMGGECEARGDYPGWMYQEHSKLRDVFKDSYKKLTGKDMIVNTIHAGLECGLFVGKKPELDCVSFGPNIYDIHTTKEKLDIESTNRTYELILDVLKNL